MQQCVSIIVKKSFGYFLGYSKKQNPRQLRVLMWYLYPGRDLNPHDREVTGF